MARSRVKTKPHTVTVLGGGNGSFQILSGLRDDEDVDLNAVVTTMDSGGDSGRLRDEFDILPPGDMRQCFLALCEDGNMLRELMAYRFTEAPLSGRQLGNLFYVALTRVTGSEQEAIAAFHRLLRVRGRVIPCTWDKVHLCAELANGAVIEGEKDIDVPKHDPQIPIKSVFLKPSARPNPEALKAIQQSTAIVLAPGDLFSSLMPILLVEEVADAIKKARAKLIYVVNLMTKLGETDGFKASHFVEQILRYTGRVPDALLAHEGRLPQGMTERYGVEHSEPVEIDTARLHALGVKQVELRALIADSPTARHDPDCTRAAIRELLEGAP